MFFALLLAMFNYFPAQLEPYLDGNLSHFIFRRPGKGVSQKIRTFLLERGIKTIREKKLEISDLDNWLVVSVNLPNISALMMELVGLGFGEGAIGIDAKNNSVRQQSDLND